MKNLKEAIKLLKKNGYIVEGMNANVDGDEFEGAPWQRKADPRWPGKEYDEWYKTVRASLWDCACGYDISIDEIKKFIERHQDDLSDGWVMKKWPKEFGRYLFNMFEEEFGI